MSDRACARVRACFEVHIPTASAPTFIPRNSESSFQEQDVKIPTPNTCDKDRHVAGKDNYRDGTGTARPPPAARTPTTPPLPFPVPHASPTICSDCVHNISLSLLLFSRKGKGGRGGHKPIQKEKERNGRKTKQNKTIKQKQDRNEGGITTADKIFKKEKEKERNGRNQTEDNNKTIKQ